MNIGMSKKIISVLTGAGVSAESGLQTFRGSDGLWNGYKISEVATADAMKNNRKAVIEFFNMRRRELKDKQPNRFHLFLAELQNKYDVHIFTQNVDDLHERAGSSNVIHLHGLLTESCIRIPGVSTSNIGYDDIDSEDLIKRPNVVLFGETPMNIVVAKHVISRADIFLVAGTSLLVNPVASLAFSRPNNINQKRILINPEDQYGFAGAFDIFIQETATNSIAELWRILS